MKFGINSPKTVRKYRKLVQEGFVVTAENMKIKNFFQRANTEKTSRFAVCFVTIFLSTHARKGCPKPRDKTILKITRNTR